MTDHDAIVARLRSLAYTASARSLALAADIHGIARDVATPSRCGAHPRALGFWGDDGDVRTDDMYHYRPASTFARAFAAGQYVAMDDEA